MVFLLGWAGDFFLVLLDIKTRLIIAVAITTKATNHKKKAVVLIKLPTNDNMPVIKQTILIVLIVFSISLDFLTIT